MKGYNFAKSVARAGNGSVIMLDCGDEEPIIPEPIKKKVSLNQYEPKKVPELDADDLW